MDSSPSANQIAQANASAMSPTRQPSRPTTSRQPSLLPAFEPLSSSPPVQSNKRKFRDLEESVKHYPTPIPTSSTGILPSSPPNRPSFQRTLSTLSERAPLGDLPSVELPANGDVIRFGRSSNSSQYQLPYNRHISRVHVTANYEAPNVQNASGRIVVKCLGWNGAKIRCGGAVHQLEKGDSWVSTQPLAEIMLDVLDCRVMIKWPDTQEKQTGRETPHIENWPEESPRRVLAGLGDDVMPSSPPAMIPRSPVSPSPAQTALAGTTGLVTATNELQESHQTTVEVYEDPNSDHVQESTELSTKASTVKQVLQEKVSSSSLSSLSADGLSDQENEENDPIVHSFGPFGSNLINRLNSFSHTSPRPRQPHNRKRPLREASKSPKREVSSSVSRKNSTEIFIKVQESPIKNHVINQLAFSRIHAIPLSTIHSNLPAELRTCATATNPNASLPTSELERLLHSLPCVGEITREGKDAAGKPLENEFYYVPEMDDNTMRREAVLGSRGGTGLRAVRKNHKQYYWKKPRV
ncbi:uncharacterized protein PV09_00576 [Verruconis gallopava]|uniref:FHA domain-containing protein n=1 Tax=Verruconis gallopava TaxID=253628 RepID=A0A0D2BBD7_9PEZI|nr:uncharacterized protein PV09_00576 [Verruconis gallopava]KIW08619.1 hypothetical protein PV09_00576 [Verruconis gallopava]